MLDMIYTVLLKKGCTSYFWHRANIPIKMMLIINSDSSFLMAINKWEKWQDEI